MTTEVMGTLPCPECGSEQELKSDGRKHTLKCHDCGLLAYYQTKKSMAHIEERLNNGKAPAVGGQVTLALSEAQDGEQHYRLTIAPLPPELMSEAANDEDGEASEADKPAAKKDKEGFFDYLETMFD